MKHAFEFDSMATELDPDREKHRSYRLDPKKKVSCRIYTHTDIYMRV